MEVDESVTTSERATKSGLCGADVFTLEKQRVEQATRGVDVPFVVAR